MFRILSAMLLASVAISSARAKTLPPGSASLTIVLDIRNAGYSPHSLTAMKTETERIFKTTGMKLDWMLKSELPPNPEFNNVVVFTMTGSCNADPFPVLIDERGPLALTYTSGDSVLPFGEVRCDRVRASLQRGTGPMLRVRSDALFGVALGRVLAHELYHMLGEVKEHTTTGVTRSGLRSDELMLGALGLDAAALARISARMHSVETSR